MTTGSDLALLALHGLRLKGFVEATAVAELFELDPVDVEGELKLLLDDDLVLRRTGTRSGWALTAAGRVENERLLALELDRLGTRHQVCDLYRRFVPINQRFHALCTDWQVADDGTVNRHDDPVRDGAVIDRLVALDGEARPLMADLAQAVLRFARYGTELAAARDRVVAGDHDWFTKPTIASYHTVWFELHEDLLATLGLDRATEYETVLDP